MKALKSMQQYVLTFFHCLLLGTFICDFGFSPYTNAFQCFFENPLILDRIWL